MVLLEVAYKQSKSNGLSLCGKFSLSTILKNIFQQARLDSFKQPPLCAIAIVIFSFGLRLLVFMLVATVAERLRLGACFAHEEG